MFLLDSLLINGISFVLDKVATIADAELNDPERQRERLLEAQLKLESRRDHRGGVRRRSSPTSSSAFARSRRARSRRTSSSTMSIAWRESR